jgi:nucleotide-binding universal stress UspA family protein
MNEPLIASMSSAEQITKILVPIDGSENSFRAASFAIGMAKNYGSELLVLHISNLNQNLQLLGFYGAPYPDTIAERIQAAKLEAQPWFDRIQKEAENQKVRIGKTEVIEGPLSIVGEIIHYAERNGVNIIVIGTRGRTGFKRLVLGSVASGIVSYAACPVLVIR